MRVFATVEFALQTNPSLNSLLLPKETKWLELVHSTDNADFSDVAPHMYKVVATRYNLVSDKGRSCGNTHLVGSHLLMCTCGTKTTGSEILVVNYWFTTGKTYQKN